MAYNKLYYDQLSNNLSCTEKQALVIGFHAQCEYLLDYQIRWSEELEEIIGEGVCPWCGTAGNSAYWGNCCSRRRQQIEQHDAARLREWSYKTGISWDAPLDYFHPDWKVWVDKGAGREWPSEPKTLDLFGPDRMDSWEEFLLLVSDLWSETPPIHQALEALARHPFKLPEFFGYKGEWVDAQPLYDKITQILGSGDLKKIRKLFKAANLTIDQGEHLFDPQTRWNLLGR